jgi:hypothetical protein
MRARKKSDTSEMNRLYNEIVPNIRDKQVLKVSNPYPFLWRTKTLFQ